MTAPVKKIASAAYIRAAMRRGFDTAAIAALCHVSEAAVWNVLAEADAKRSAPEGAQARLAPVKGSSSLNSPGGFGLPAAFLGAVVGCAENHRRDLRAGDLTERKPFVFVAGHQGCVSGASEPPQ